MKSLSLSLSLLRRIPPAYLVSFPVACLLVWLIYFKTGVFPARRGGEAFLCSIPLGMALVFPLLAARRLFHPFMVIYSLVTVYLFSFLVRLNARTALSDFFLILLAVAALNVLLTGIRVNFARNVLRGLGAVIFGGMLALLAGTARYLHNMNNSALPGVEKQPIFLLSVDEVSAFFQTSFRECLEFFNSFFSAGEKGVFLAVFLCGIMLIWQACRHGERPSRDCSVFFFGGVLAAACGLFVIYDPLAEPLAYVAHIKRHYAQVTEEFVRQRELCKEHGSVTAVKEGQGELYVLVLGESSNKRHWSAWGYVRDTTPWTASLRDDENTFFFENAYSSYCHTVPSLTKALTKANQYNGLPDAYAPSLMEVARAAGFNVFWLSNQDKTTLGDNPLTVLSLDSDYTEFTTRARFSSDADLIPLLDRVLERLDFSKNNLIILHSIGSHFDYARRVPRGFRPEFVHKEEYLGHHARDAKFMNEILDPYDRTIRFTDVFLQAVSDRLEKTPARIRMLCYASDHGEDVYGRGFHNSGAFTYDMARIPMFVRVSPSYIEKYAATADKLRRRTEDPFTLDLLYNVMISLMGIRTPEAEERYDPLSSSYEITWQNAVTMKTDSGLDSRFYLPCPPQMLKDDPLIVEKNNLEHLRKACPDKRIAAIACDVLGTGLQSLGDGFNGVEINVNAPDMRIGHAPQLVYDMTVEEYLAKIGPERLETIWLDIKMLEEEGIDEFIQKLEELDSKYQIKNRTIIETTLVSHELCKISDNGWNLCYYMFIKFTKDGINNGYSDDFLNIVQNLPPEKEDEIRMFAQMIAKNIIDQKSKSFSFWGHAYKFVKKYVEPLLPQEITYNVFAVVGADIMSSNSMREFDKNPVMQDPRVRTVLASGNTYFGEPVLP